MSRIDSRASNANSCGPVDPWSFPDQRSFQAYQDKRQATLKTQWNRETARRRLRALKFDNTRTADGSFSFSKTGDSIARAASSPVSTIRKASSLLWDATKEKAKYFGVETREGWTDFSKDVSCMFSGQ